MSNFMLASEPGVSVLEEQERIRLNLIRNLREMQYQANEL